jgi:hypothetical protein
MKLALIACGTLLAGGVAIATTNDVDVNRTKNRVQLTEEQLRTLVQYEVDKSGSRPLAVAVIPGKYGDFDIDLHLVNLTRTNITDVTFDPFKALNGKALIIDTCWAVSSDIVLEYPVAYGRGPMVLRFEHFGPLGVRQVGLDPDTYESPSFGATVLEMSGSVIEIAFENGARGVGELHATDYGVAAFVYPTYLPVGDRVAADRWLMPSF